MCPSEQRFLLLFTFLKKNLKKKVMVFLSSCNSVKFHSELLNYIDIPVLDIHVSANYDSLLFVIRWDLQHISFDHKYIINFF